MQGPGDYIPISWTLLHVARRLIIIQVVLQIRWSFIRYSQYQQ